MLQPLDNTEIHFAPLQGYTDRVYRTSFQRFFEGVDVYYSPYMMVGKTDEVDGIEDIMPFQDYLVPQILPGNLRELKLLVNALSQLSYKKVNINMGCPYKMVTGKGRGAALMQNPSFVTDLVNYIHENTSIELSLKLRSGLETEDEIFNLLDKIPLDKVSELIIHPRTAKQLYKGEANVQVVKKCKDWYPDSMIIYNGDITSLEDFRKVNQLLEGQEQWMLGRGLLHNPFLAMQIKANSASVVDSYQSRIIQFMNKLITETINDSKDKGHALNRCKIQCSYLLQEFSVFKKPRKKIIKAKSMDELLAVVEGMNG